MPRVPECAVNRTGRRTQSCRQSSRLSPVEPRRRPARDVHRPSPWAGTERAFWTARGRDRAVAFRQQLAKFVARETRPADLGLARARSTDGISSSNINHQFLLSRLGIERTANQESACPRPDSLPPGSFAHRPLHRPVRRRSRWLGVPDLERRMTAGPVIPYVDNRIQPQAARRLDLPGRMLPWPSTPPRSRAWPPTPGIVTPIIEDGVHRAKSSHVREDKAGAHHVM